MKGYTYNTAEDISQAACREHEVASDKAGYQKNSRLNLTASVLVAFGESSPCAPCAKGNIGSSASSAGRKTRDRIVCKRNVNHPLDAQCLRSHMFVHHIVLEHFPDPPAFGVHKLIRSTNLVLKTLKHGDHPCHQRVFTPMDLVGIVWVVIYI